EPLDTEPASPAGDEVLVGSTDMLAGPDAAPTEDLAEALDENEPWTPPDVPQLAPTATEQRGGWAQENALALSEWEDEGGEPDDLLDDEDRAARDGVSAPDLARADLDRAARGGPLSSLGATAAPPGGDPEAEPEPFESGSWADDMVEQVPGTAKGPGAVGEYETEGGELGSIPALETGAIGADTAPAAPARDASGGTQKMAGTDRGPAAPDDRAVREEIEDGQGRAAGRGPGGAAPPGGPPGPAVAPRGPGRPARWPSRGAGRARPSGGCRCRPSRRGGPGARPRPGWSRPR